MTSLVDCLDYIVQEGKATINGTASPPPQGTENTRFERDCSRQFQLDQRSSI